MSVDSVAWAPWGPRWRGFGGVGCGSGGALDRQHGCHGLGMGVGCDCVQGVANVVAQHCIGGLDTSKHLLDNINFNSTALHVFRLLLSTPTEKHE